jgi:hypothetical protein
MSTPEIASYNKKSGVKSIKLEEIEGRKLMLVQFGLEKNFWKDLSWAPIYQELTFIFHHLDLAEKFNFEDKENLSNIDVTTSLRIKGLSLFNSPIVFQICQQDSIFR